MKRSIFPSIYRALFWVYLAILVSCNSGSNDVHDVHADSPQPVRQDTPTIVKVDTGGIRHPDSTRHPTIIREHPLVRRDTPPGPGPLPPAEKKSATLGYSYPLSIPRGETRYINAYVTIKYPASFIKDTLKEIIIEQKGDYSEKKDTIVIYPRNIIFYRSLSVSLVDPSNDFAITRIHNADTQVVDTTNGNRWQWSISTKTDKKAASLILKATGMGPDGAPDIFDPKTIRIKITVDPYITRSFFDYLTDNPAVSVPLIVAFLGFIGWLIKYWLGRKKGEG